VIRTYGGRRILREGKVGRLRRQKDELGCGGWQRRRNVGLREQQGYLGVSEHEAQPFARVLGVDGNVGSASLQNGEKSDDHFERALHRDADQCSRGDSKCEKLPGHLVASEVQLAVGK